MIVKAGVTVTPLRVKMLGEFSISSGLNQISDSENRSHKIWALLAYLLYHRHRAIPQSELLDLLWGESARGTNPTGALKTTFHRVRATLDRLGPSAGHQLILSRDGGYIWNPDISVEVDVDDFERLCTMEHTGEEERLDNLLVALKMYRGDFLSRQSSAAWTHPVSTCYHNLYVQSLMEVLPMLNERGRHQEIVELCQFAASVEPHHEPIHQFWMRGLLNLGKHEIAAAVYRELSDRMYTHFGVLPEEETRSLHREATRMINDHAVTIETVLEQLEESNSPRGAMICDYDFFLVLCRSVARSMTRTGIATHVVLMTVTGKDSPALATRSLLRVMDNLEEQIRINLRRGDSAARCSGSQFVLMLPQANYENSKMVSDRIVRAFIRQYPHSPAAIQYTIHPLRPN